MCMHIIRHFVSPSSGHRHVKFTEMSFLDSILLSYGAHESCSYMELINVTLNWSSSNILLPGAHQIYTHLDLIKLTLTWISSKLQYSNLDLIKLTLIRISSKLL